MFYVIGTLTILWFVLWCFFVYDTPAKHPRISSEELNFIEKTIGNQTSKVVALKIILCPIFDSGKNIINMSSKTYYYVKGKVPTPWKAIFSSMPFWAILAGHIGHAWGLYTLLHELPSYLKNMLHFEIREVKLKNLIIVRNHTVHHKYLIAILMCLMEYRIVGCLHSPTLLCGFCRFSSPKLPIG